MSENWRPVVGFEGAYEVSDQGRVRSLDRVLQANGKRGYPKHMKGRVLKPQQHSGGYQQIGLCGKLRLVHALVLEAFVGPCPSGEECRHRNDIKTDNRLSNLRYGTHSENCKDRADNGGDCVGERNGSAVLTAEAVRAIRSVGYSVTEKELAARFGTGTRNIGKIRRGERWRHG